MVLNGEASFLVRNVYLTLGSKDGKKGRKDQLTARARISNLSYFLMIPMPRLAIISPLRLPRARCCIHVCGLWIPSFGILIMNIFD